MVVDYFNVDGMFLIPLETHTPLVIDADAVLFLAIARQVFLNDSPVESEDLVRIQPHLGGVAS